jgi:hypothetical protein
MRNDDLFKEREFLRFFHPNTMMHACISRVLTIHRGIPRLCPKYSQFAKNSFGPA